VIGIQAKMFTEFIDAQMIGNDKLAHFTRTVSHRNCAKPTMPGWRKAF